MRAHARRDRRLDNHGAGGTAGHHGIASSPSRNRGTQTPTRNQTQPHGTRRRKTLNRLLYIFLGLIAATLILLVWNGQSGTTFGLENDDFASVVSLSLMAAWIGLGLFSGRFPPGTTLRNVAIWLAILLGVAAGYQYRRPLQDFASTVSLGLVPASPQTARGLNGSIEVSLGRYDSGHFEANAQVNGQSVRFLVDTGASSIVLSNRDAASAGLDMSSLKFTVPVSTANGKAMAATARMDEIAIGGIIRRDMRVLVAAEGALDQSLLGMDFLDTLKGYAVEQDRMILKD